jgi:hypothetical protein
VGATSPNLGAAFGVEWPATGAAGADHWLQQNGLLEWKQALVLIRPIADALDYLHAERIVYLDVLASEHCHR